MGYLVLFEGLEVVSTVTAAGRAMDILCNYEFALGQITMSLCSEAMKIILSLCCCSSIVPYFFGPGFRNSDSLFGLLSHLF